MSIKIKQHGNFSALDKFLLKIRRKTNISIQAQEIAEECVKELKKATPKDTGLTADSWTYEIVMMNNKTSIVFYNTNIQNGMNVALLLEYGHGTSSGQWVEGQDYIDPVIRKNYLKVVNTKWKELTKV